VSVLEGGYGQWKWERVPATPKVLKLKVEVRFDGHAWVVLLWVGNKKSPPARLKRPHSSMTLPKM